MSVIDDIRAHSNVLTFVYSRFVRVMGTLVNNRLVVVDSWCGQAPLMASKESSGSGGFSIGPGASLDGVD